VIVDELDREPGRDFSRCMATHAIGHDTKSLALRKRDRVLVVIALATDVGRACESDSHPVERE
jgi:hypothetical protein